MEHKDIWLVLGLTVVLAIAVSLSTVSLTGDVIAKKSADKTTNTAAAQITAAQKQGIINDATNNTLNKLNNAKVVIGSSAGSNNCTNICINGPWKNYKCIFSAIQVDGNKVAYINECQNTETLSSSKRLFCLCTK